MTRSIGVLLTAFALPPLSRVPPYSIRQHISNHSTQPAYRCVFEVDLVTFISTLFFNARRQPVGVLQRYAECKMRDRLFLMIAFVTFVAACERNSEFEDIHLGMELPEPWYSLTYPHDKYPEMQPNRPIIISFGAHWCIGGQAFRVLFSHRVSERLRENGWLCLVADVTNRDEFLMDEMNRLEIKSLPATVVFNPETSKWEVLPQLLSEEVVFEAIRRCTP